MRKLKLEIDAIEVASFEVNPLPPTSRGTVDGQQSGLQFTCDPGGCMNTYGCHTAYCAPSHDIYCPTATCHDGCNTTAPTWDQTCPPTCDWGGGCESTQPQCPL